MLHFFLEWATPNQEAKVTKAYDDAFGVPVNWTNFDTGTAMTEAMLAGDIDISYSQGLAPFINAVNAKRRLNWLPLQYSIRQMIVFVRTGEGIDKTNANDWKAKPLPCLWRPWPTTASV